MAILKLTLHIGDETLERTIDQSQTTLGMLEDIEAAQDSRRMRDMIPVIAQLLDLTREQARAITMPQFMEITNTLMGSDAVPNDSASPSETP